MTRYMTAIALLGMCAVDVHGEWRPVPGRIMTKWADDVAPVDPLPAYPRPQLVRDNGMNLNGAWNHAVTGVNDSQPTEFAGQVLVPFCIESGLSGVKRKLTPAERLWYSCGFTASALGNGERVILNFGAVDYQATVYVNGQEIGAHIGGYAPPISMLRGDAAFAHPALCRVLEETAEIPHSDRKIHSVARRGGVGRDVKVGSKKCLKRFQTELKWEITKGAVR